MNQFDDLSKVEKYEISEADYDKRNDTVRAFKKRMQAAGHPQFQNAQGEDTYQDYMKEEAEAMFTAELTTGQRCELSVGGRRGEVKYIGKVSGMGAGFWVGVQLDEPTGDSDGSFKGTKFFESTDKSATFVRPNELAIGDYPEKDIFDEDEDEI